MILGIGGDTVGNRDEDDTRGNREDTGGSEMTLGIRDDSGDQR